MLSGMAFLIEADVNSLIFWLNARLASKQQRYIASIWIMSDRNIVVGMQSGHRCAAIETTSAPALIR
jgi:hypothetical protein